ncbi:hypothetical protein HYC85_029276 [Camellia sinensis]|uniref:Uncharacterized protein n=1 Tax=Camellia sinensis TaxID=4442 RepID=A0A7J7FXN5_CAMSI|nr:hypothetical protein HYC85_029276 [Camellia sinensis]
MASISQDTMIYTDCSSTLNNLYSELQPKSAGMIQYLWRSGDCLDRPEQRRSGRSSDQTQRNLARAQKASLEPTTRSFRSATQKHARAKKSSLERRNPKHSPRSLEPRNTTFRSKTRRRRTLEQRNPGSSEVTKTQSLLKRQKSRSSEDTKNWAATICFETHPTYYKPAQHIPKLKYKEFKDENETYVITDIHGTESGIHQPMGENRDLYWNKLVPPCAVPGLESLIYIHLSGGVRWFCVNNLSSRVQTRYVYNKNGKLMNLSFGRLPLIYTNHNWHKLAQMTVNSVVGICKIVLISWHSRVPRSLRWVFVALQRALVNFIPYWKLRRIPKGMGCKINFKAQPLLSSTRTCIVACMHNGFKVVKIKGEKAVEKYKPNSTTKFQIDQEVGRNKKMVHGSSMVDSLTKKEICKPKGLTKQEWKQQNFLKKSKQMLNLIKDQTGISRTPKEVKEKEDSPNLFNNLEELKYGANYAKFLDTLKRTIGNDSTRIEESQQKAKRKSYQEKTFTECLRMKKLQCIAHIGKQLKNATLKVYHNYKRIIKYMAYKHLRTRVKILTTKEKAIMLAVIERMKKPTELGLRGDAKKHKPNSTKKFQIDQEAGRKKKMRGKLCQESRTKSCMVATCPFHDWLFRIWILESDKIM